MPKPKHPRVASVRITREGDAAFIRYADDSVAVTYFTSGAERLKGMTDQDFLDLWNGGLEAMEEHRKAFEYVATEVPVGKPQVSFFEPGNQWTPGGHVLRCELLTEPTMRKNSARVKSRPSTAGGECALSSSRAGSMPASR